ncbi:TrmB family transcriptional regulator [Halapricum hydrolyticum]|uniref:TrmB family transcriptional regulator n=1 Tax=Halapricum hydrolyticum TaxID=2979991 RepID=A0AAE3IAL7_9EURY|nr:helix-turn-helix domain-containing protein [Halapricum hydrolyticum]MCU4717861.1 TrmB family transcriptional regulator [Halapricum hydrolyticum]MCU4727026.1 TrmB family transcriptional regulator [Halapricum hydrolyticum]
MSDAEDLLAHLDLREYETTALRELLTLGRSTAPNLAEATGIPRARIYEVLDELADRGFVEVIPGRPKEYQAKHPEEILDRAVENERQDFESFRAEIEDVREEFVSTFGPLFERASGDITPTEDLFHVVDVGEPSETETRQLYHDAEREVHVLTKSFAYLESIRPALEDALNRGVEIRVLMLDPAHLSPDNREVQATIYQELTDSRPGVEVRFSNEKLPLRGTVADPSMDYESGKAILLVEEKDVPLSMRQAAVTDNGSFVAGIERLFELIWEHDSTDAY